MLFFAVSAVPRMKSRVCSYAVLSLLLLLAHGSLAWFLSAPLSSRGAASIENASEETTGRFELLDGDRVVFLGDTFIEREQAFGYVEARLTLEFPNRNVTFRNLGWSADTVLGRSRASFDWT